MTATVSEPKSAGPAPRRRSRFEFAVVSMVVVIVAVALVSFEAGRHTASPRSAASTPGTVDVGFSQDMAAHHDQAVLMANIAMSRGGAVQGVADSILLSQSQEIGQLRGWLQTWNEPIADLHPMNWMPASAMPRMTMNSPMPGMATPSQMSTLYNAQGTKFDVLFLQLMIRHHQGGIEMAHYAETHARLAAVRTAATAMRVEEVQDLTELEPLLKADGGKQLPAP